MKPRFYDNPERTLKEKRSGQEYHASNLGTRTFTLTSKWSFWNMYIGLGPNKMNIWPKFHYKSILFKRFMKQKTEKKCLKHASSESMQFQDALVSTRCFDKLNIWTYCKEFRRCGADGNSVVQSFDLTLKRYISGSLFFLLARNFIFSSWYWLVHGTESRVIL